jgi:uncharacterized protein YfkK (UPF0435 family)
VEDFSIHITAIANELRVLGDEVTDKEVVKKMLHSVPEKLEQVAISMETLLDLNSLSIEEVVSHLQAVEQRKKVSAPQVIADVGGRLLLTEEEWSTCLKAKENGGPVGAAAPGEPTVTIEVATEEEVTAAAITVAGTRVHVMIA